MSHTHVDGRRRGHGRYVSAPHPLMLTHTRTRAHTHPSITAATPPMPLRASPPPRLLPPAPQSASLARPPPPPPPPRYSSPPPSSRPWWPSPPSPPPSRAAPADAALFRSSSSSSRPSTPRLTSRSRTKRRRRRPRRRPREDEVPRERGGKEGARVCAPTYPCTSRLFLGRGGRRHDCACACALAGFRCTDRACCARTSRREGRRASSMPCLNDCWRVGKREQ